MATWAVLIQFMMVLFVGLTSGKAVTLNEDGTPVWELSMHMLKYVALALKWVSTFLYGGLIAVIAGVYTMMQVNAYGSGPRERRTAEEVAQLLLHVHVCLCVSAELVHRHSLRDQG